MSKFATSNLNPNLNTRPSLEPFQIPLDLLLLLPLLLLPLLLLIPLLLLLLVSRSFEKGELEVVLEPLSLNGANRLYFVVLCSTILLVIIVRLKIILELSKS